MKEVKIYDSIDELPIVNYQKFNKLVLLDSGIGSDIISADEHIVKIAKLIGKDNNKAMQELQNLRQNMHMIVTETSPKFLSFAALIHSIDGEEVKDLSDDNLKAIIKSLDPKNNSLIQRVIEEIKKKLLSELDLYFPSTFNSAKEKEAYDKVKARTLIELNGIIDGVDVSKQIQEIDDEMFSKYVPKCFFGKDSVEIAFDKQFETSCFVISQKTNLNAKSLTTLEFYNTLSLIEKQAEAESKAYKKIKTKS